MIRNGRNNVEEVVTKPIEKIVAVMPVPAEFWEGLNEDQQDALLQEMEADALHAFESEAVLTSPIKHGVHAPYELAGVYLPIWAYEDQDGNERVAPRVVMVRFSAYGYRKDDA
ncbi:hypothetical protein SEA_PETERSON_47 [Mycobacterium phage Peterson]|nr:hypothetical protein SEA_PETERSON_47 [Mycobacterium phage Peterson]